MVARGGPVRAERPAVTVDVDNVGLTDGIIDLRVQRGENQPG